MNKHESSYLQHVLKNYLTFPHEKIIFAKRQSILTLIPGIAIVSILSLLVIGMSYPLFFILIPLPYLFFVTIAVTIATAFFLGIKHIVEWYFHMYIVTNKKLLEVRYVPLSSYTINDVLLDQVQCTEIDLRMNGFIYELLDIGNIAITFDRPTHQAEFIFSHIGYAREIAALLTNQLSRYAANRSQNMLWYKNNNATQPDKKYTMIDLSPS